MTYTCETCKFWVKGSNMPRNAATFAPDGGECRKLPPRGGQFHVYQEASGEEKIVSVVSFPFPPTHRLDWCGEWMPDVSFKTAEEKT